jgi:hypothetical protein
MIGERQLQHMLEKIRQHEVAAAMREAIGEPGDQRRGGDDEQAEGDPGADQRRQGADRGSHAGGKRAGQSVDDMPEQHRFDELRNGERDVGERQQARKPNLRREQVEHSEIDA